MRFRINPGGASRKLLIVGGVLVIVFILAVIFFAFKEASEPKSNQSSDPFLTITEWGVRIPLSEGNRDMYYKLVKYQGGIGEGVKIYSKDLDDLKNVNNAACANNAYPLLVISRVFRQRGALMNNPNMPEYDPTSGPYKTYEFQTDYAFGPSRGEQAFPSCANLNAGTDRAFIADKTVTDVLQKKKSALTDGYAKLLPVPTPTSEEKK